MYTSLPSIVFFGTPDFASAALEYLFFKNVPIVGVVTTPDKPAGRGLNLKASPVKQKALELNLPIVQPQSLKDPAFIASLIAMNAEAFVVVAFRKLPAEVWQIPPKGAINLHASLLPQYRGAAPINHAIIQGETITGLTTFFINDRIDEGHIILQKVIPIGPDDTAGDLYEKMKAEGPPLLLQTLEWIQKFGPKYARPQPSDSAPLKTAPRLTRENTRIHWEWPAAHIRNFVRGLAPQPGAWCSVPREGKPPDTWKIFQCRAEEDGSGGAPSSYTPGQLVAFGHTLKIRCYDGWIVPLVIQQAGRKPQQNETFLRGIHNQGFPILKKSEPT
ncbi:MAG: methionyl-tRNA formyltransferase [Flavobacteriales bacterium]|nr:methionyl-tRNA formyltransferase [Flavobacteriales bacterium]MCX7767703.1 methionyl-tRNA formyltransferase [Flavobacteriales bacterium]MDW8409402.1 methionyl-tRNA formyltransferase [Flavobacteriales bacterium]